MLRLAAAGLNLVRAVAGWAPPPVAPLVVSGELTVHHVHRHEVVDDDCGHDEPDLDTPAVAQYVIPAEGLWHLLARAAHRAHNGDDPTDAATGVMIDLELEQAEAEVSGGDS